MMYKLTYDKAVLETDALTTAEAMVALSWASVCDYKTGSNVRQSFDAVATKAKMSRRNVIRITQSLVTKGWLVEVERQPYKPTVYALTIPTSDNTSLVTDEAGLVTSETPLVTNGTPTSDTMSPNKNNNKKIDKNKDKNKNNTDGVDDLPLGGSTEEVAPPIEKVLRQSKDYDLALSLFLDREFKKDRDENKRARLACWEADIAYDERIAQEALEASENLEVGKHTNKASQAGRENPRPVDDPMTDEDVEVEW